MAKKDNDFDLINLPEAARDPEITAEDFVLQHADSEIHEQKFQTKPTTFLKDSLKRFSKNKSSVVAAYILGFLILLSIFVPIVSPYDVANPAKDNAFNYLEPKLFNGGTGFWDGTVKKSHVPVDTSSSNPDEWWPDETYYKRDGITDYHVSSEEYTSDISKFGRGGFLRVGYYGTYGLTEGTIETLDSSTISDQITDRNVSLNLDTTTLTLTVFDTVNEEKINKYHDYQVSIEPNTPELPEEVLPENFELGKVCLIFNYFDDTEEEYKAIELTDNKVVHNTGASIDVPEKDPIDIGLIIKNNTSQRVFNKFYFTIRVQGLEDTPVSESVCSLIRGLSIKVGDNASKGTKAYFEGDTFTKSVGGNNYTAYIPGISFTDAMQFMTRESKVSVSDMRLTNTGYWSVENLTKFTKSIHLGRCTYASFTYDSYKGALGVRSNIEITQAELESYFEKGWIDYNIDLIFQGGKYIVNPATFTEPTLNSGCPIVEEFTIDDVIVKSSSQSYSVKCTVLYYRYLGYDTMPTFLFGTDQTGRDMFKYVFEGLRNSLLLGVITFIVCFLFGLLWGSVSGYFGGAVDLAMERITDILAGVPWIVLMTIVILKAGQNFGTFVVALCLTGWIGTASTTRTQFYRFRGREYVLASRTLGASDARLIAKHILPNAMGTIITGAVLMIPSVIFSEATISYLGLGFRGLSSLGVILSSNQTELLSHPFLLLFPATVIALVMISFNLFGNGLRDAINPSLKGEE